MATKKISALALIAGAAISATDVVPLVDMDAGTPTTYRATAAQLRSSIFKASGAGWDPADYVQLGGGPILASGVLRVAQGTLTADGPLLNSTATWNAGTALMRHVLINVTDVASNANSLLVDLQVAGISKWRVGKAGDVAQSGNLTVGGVATIQNLTMLGAAAMQAMTATTGTFSGLVIAPFMEITGAAGTLRELSYRTAGVVRWDLYADLDGEGGANAGSTFKLSRYSDAGAFLGTPITITRATGTVAMESILTVGTLVVASAGTGDLVLASELRFLNVAGTDTIAVLKLDLSDGLNVGRIGASINLLGNPTMTLPLITNGMYLTGTSPGPVSAGTVGIGAEVVTTATPGGGGATPANVSGYLKGFNGGTAIRIPFYLA